MPEAKKLVAEFKTKFVQEDVHCVMEEYDSFRKKAILDKGMYTNLKVMLSCEKESLKKVPWKYYVYEQFKILVELCEKGEGYWKGELSNVMERVLKGIASQSFWDYESRIDTNIRYAIFRMMLDVICAYVYDMRKICYSAILYDMICHINESDDPIKDFYGVDAEEEIVSHTLDIIRIISKKENIDSKTWIHNASYNLPNGFSREFSKKLLEKERVNSEKISRRKQKAEKNIIYVLYAVAIICTMGIFFFGGLLVGTKVCEYKLKQVQEKIELQDREISDMEEQILELERENDDLEEQAAINKENGISNLDTVLEWE